jgi:hypothetical protein
MSSQTAVAPHLDVLSLQSIRGHRVILDSDLALIYGVETRMLNRAVKRNAEPVPAGIRLQADP